MWINRLLKLSPKFLKLLPVDHLQKLQFSSVLGNYLKIRATDRLDQKLARNECSSFHDNI